MKIINVVAAIIRDANGRILSTQRGFDKSIRICLKLSEYKPFTYGLDCNAAIGIALTRAQFKEYCKSAL